jgi:hypothetical protein
MSTSDQDESILAHGFFNAAKDTLLESAAHQIMYAITFHDSLSQDATYSKCEERIPLYTRDQQCYYAVFEHVTDVHWLDPDDVFLCPSCGLLIYDIE